MWKQNISQNMLLQNSYIMSCSIKELGVEGVTYYENRTDDDSKIVSQIAEHIADASFIIAHNGRKFDIPLIKARAIVNGLKPFPPFKVIDTLDIAKKEFRFNRNTLDNLAKELKVEHEKLTNRKFNGFELWSECLKQNDEAWEEMREYNELDVIVLEEVYLKLRGWYSTHPAITTATTTEDSKKRCPRCAGETVRAGYYFTNKGKYQRYRCLCCNSWSSESTMSKLQSKQARANIIVSK